MATNNSTNVTSMDDVMESVNTIKEGIANGQTQEQLLKIMEELNSTMSNILDSQASTPGLTQKLKSRKFWVAALGFVAGFCGMLNAGQNTAAMLIYVCFVIVSVVG